MSACAPSTNHPRVAPFNGNDMKNVAMHAVAALLNATLYGARYPVIGMQTPGAVVTAFQAAFDAQTEQAMNSFVSRVDVYTSSNTWCDGEPHGNP